MKKRENKKQKGLLLQEWLLLLVVLIGFAIIGYGTYLKMMTNTTPSYMVTLVGTFLFVPGLLSLMMILEVIINGCIKLRNKRKSK